MLFVFGGGEVGRIVWPGREVIFVSCGNLYFFFVFVGGLLKSVVAYLVNVFF